ncbi:hypothetical protein WN944_018717 [Citrus x changshan-huyou]|uniref:Uncharacterized protein n=1 Tax=Citrus x changshan-huyou TaxID=2935761 RepID=A0AAP0QEF7_9ROSI
MLRNYMDFSFYLGIPMLGTVSLDLGYILWKCLFKSLLPFVWADDYFLPLLFPLICRWRGFNPRYKPVDWVQVERKRQNKERTLEEHKKLVEKILKRDQKRRKRIEAAGIEYECPEIVGNVMPAPKKIKFNEGSISYASQGSIIHLHCISQRHEINHPKDPKYRNQGILKLLLRTWIIHRGDLPLLRFQEPPSRTLCWRFV